MQCSFFISSYAGSVCARTVSCFSRKRDNAGNAVRYQNLPAENQEPVPDKADPAVPVPTVPFSDELPASGELPASVMEAAGFFMAVSCQNDTIGMRAARAVRRPILPRIQIPIISIVPSSAIPRFPYSFTGRSPPLSVVPAILFPKNRHYAALRFSIIFHSFECSQFEKWVQKCPRQISRGH